MTQPSTLTDLIGRGIVWELPSGEFIGTASDGIEVSLGDCRDSTEAYLVTHPTPDTW